ncbi:MAG: PAS domain-containing sensor histidine kinase [Syntrophobacteraceae bacterium]
MDEDIGRSILREQVRLAMEQLPTMQLASLIVAAVLCYAVRDSVSSKDIFLWGALILSVCLGRVSLYRSFSKIRNTSFSASRWKNGYLLQAFISGTFWGLSAFLIFPAGNLVLISFFVLVMGGLAAGTLLSHLSIRFASSAWALPALLPYAVRCSMGNGHTGYTLTVLILVYLVAIQKHALQHNRFITESISLGFENLNLLGEVKKVNENLCREISARKAAQEMLSQSEEKFRLIFESSPDSITVTRLKDGIFLDVSDAFTTLTGYSREEVVERSSLELVWNDPEDRGRFIDDIQNTGFVENFEAKLHAKDGSVRFGVISGRLLQTNRDELLLTIFRDITERKLIEQSLRESDLRFQTILQTANEGFWLIDSDTRTLEINPRMCEILGRDREEIVGRKIYDFVDTQNKAVFEHQIRMRARGESASYEIALSRPDETPVYCNFNVTPFLDGSGERIGSFAMVTDITARKLAEKRLREIPSMLLEAQEEERKRLASELHDSIGQTLAALKFRLEFILDIMRKGEQAAAIRAAEEFVPILQRSIDETRAIYMALRPKVLEDFGVIAALRWYRDELLKLYPERHIEIDFRCEESQIPDRLVIPLFRIAQEALNNASKHSRAEWVDLAITANGHGMELVVSDDGVGMEVDQILQSSSARSLGLDGMRERAEMFGGRLTIISAPGKGTTVRARWENIAEEQLEPGASSRLS